MQRSELIERWLIILWCIGWGCAIAGIWLYPLFTAIWIVLHVLGFGIILFGFLCYFLWEWAIEPTIEYLRGE